MQERILKMLMDKDEITWQSIIYDLVKSEQMNPWDMDITLLAQKYLEIVKNLEEHNFFISGKVVLAAAILLKLKTNQLINEHMPGFDDILFPKEDDLLGDEGYVIDPETNEVIPDLLIKTPQARKRRIDLNDLMGALDKALKVEHKRIARKRGERVFREAEIPERKIDITDLIKSVYDRVSGWFKTKPKVTFSELVGNNATRDDKIYTFMPLLYLSNSHDINIHQEIPFGEIEITKPVKDDGNEENVSSVPEESS